MKGIFLWVRSRPQPPHLLIGAYRALNFYPHKPSVIKTTPKLAIGDSNSAPYLQPGHSPSSRNSANLAFIPLGGPSIDAAWRPRHLRRLATPAFTPLGDPSIYAVWRVQCLRRLAGPVFTPLGESSIDAVWRAQCLRRLASPVFISLGGEPSVYATWRTQCLPRVAANPVFTSPGDNFFT